MTTPNLFTNSAPAQSYTAVNGGMDGAGQTEGQALFQQASQSHQPDVLVKRQFEQRNQNQKSKLANEFVASAGREGVSQLAATPNGQHALAMVYDHAGSDGRGLMRQVHEEQGSTAVDYSQKEKGDGSTKEPSQRVTQAYQNHEESLASDYKELVQQYASVIKKLAVKHENRVEVNGVGETIYRDIVNTLHSLAGSPMRINNDGQYRSSMQKPVSEKEQFNQLRQNGIVLELVMNEPEARAIFKKEFGEAWNKVADWGVQEWTPLIAEATLVAGASIFGKKAVQKFDISNDVAFKNNNTINNNDIGRVNDGDSPVSENVKIYEGRTAGQSEVHTQNKVYTEQSVFSVYPKKTTLSTTGIGEQSKFLSKHVPGLTEAQARIILEKGFAKANAESPIVFGGSRIRGDFNPGGYVSGSDIDVGFANLTANQAGKVIDTLNKQFAKSPDLLRLESTRITPGNVSPTIEDPIKSPEEFFQRSGIRISPDSKVGQPFIPSGSITVRPGGTITLIPPGEA